MFCTSRDVLSIFKSFMWTKTLPVISVTKDVIVIKPPATTATLKAALWGDSRRRKQNTGPRFKCISTEWFQWAQILASYQILRGAKLINLRCLVSLINSDLLMFWLPVFLAKCPKYPGSSLTSSEQSLRAIWEAVSWLKSSVCLLNKTEFSTFRLCIFFQSTFNCMAHVGKCLNVIGWTVNY